MKTGIQMTEYTTYNFTPEQLEEWIKDYCENTPPEDFDEDYIKESLIDSLRGYGTCKIEQSEDDICDLYQVVKEVKKRMNPAHAVECNNIRDQLNEITHQLEDLYERLEALEKESNYG